MNMNDQVIHTVEFVSGDGISTIAVPCVFEADPVDTVRRVHRHYSHLAERTDNGGVFYTIAGADCPADGLRVHVDRYNRARVI